MSLSDLGQAYCDQGYVVSERLFSADELTLLKDDLVKLARRHYPCESLQPVSSDMSDEDALANILYTLSAPCVPVIKAFTQHEKLSSVLTQIVGAHR